MSNKDLVVNAATELFINQDPTAIDRWFGPGYIQHSTVAADGLEGLSALATNLPDNFGYELVRVLADDDLVALHGIYTGFGPEPLVAFDVFRVADGRIVEHWDALTPQVAETLSGRTQTDGPTTVVHPDQSEATRKLVTEFAQKVLIEADYSVLTDFISTETYDQHNTDAADGLAGFGDAAARWANDGRPLDYAKVHKLIVDGEFALIQSEGTFGEPVAYWDLFRVDDGRIVEHWDIIQTIPTELPHDNGLF